MAKNLEARIAELEDREAIKELCHMYCHTVDTLRVAECAALFSDDAVADFDPPFGVFRGKEAIRKFYCEGVPAYFPFMVHAITNHTIRVDGNKGESSCYFDFKGTSAKGQSVIAAGRYDDEVVKINGQWKFKRRKCVFFFFIPATETWDKKNPLKLQPADLG